MYDHRIVALAFRPNENNYPCIDHINGDRLDNSVSNIRWCTSSMNNSNPITRKRQDDARRNDPILKRWVSKEIVAISISDSSDIRIYRTVGSTKNDGFNPSQVSATCLGKRKNHKGFTFYYKSEYEALIKSKNESKPTQSDYQQPQPPQHPQELQLPLQLEP